VRLVAPYSLISMPGFPATALLDRSPIIEAHALIFESSLNKGKIERRFGGSAYFTYSYIYIISILHLYSSSTVAAHSSTNTAHWHPVPDQPTRCLAPGPKPAD
jgi:hypothetical protein